MPQSPYELEALWRNAPAERNRHYHIVFFRVAGALQKALRSHVSACWDPVAHAADPIVNLSVLAWTCAEPARESSVADFTYDLLDTRLMRSFYWSARQNLPERLRQICSELSARSASDLVRAYRPSRMGSIMRTLKTRRATLARLIGTEMRLMD